MSAKLYDLARMTVASAPGTGTITLGAAAVGGDGTLFLSFAAAGVLDQDIITYALNDPTGASEIGQGTYTAAGPTLSRDRIFSSTAFGSPVNASAAAQVFICISAEDLDETAWFDHASFGGV